MEWNIRWNKNNPNGCCDLIAKIKTIVQGDRLLSSSLLSPDSFCSAIWFYFIKMQMFWRCFAIFCVRSFRKTSISKETKPNGKNTHSELKINELRVACNHSFSSGTFEPSCDLAENILFMNILVTHKIFNLYRTRVELVREEPKKRERKRRKSICEEKTSETFVCFIVRM